MIGYPNSRLYFQYIIINYKYSKNNYVLLHNAILNSYYVKIWNYNFQTCKQNFLSLNDVFLYGSSNYNTLKLNKINLHSYTFFSILQKNIKWSFFLIFIIQVEVYSYLSLILFKYYLLILVTILKFRVYGLFILSKYCLLILVIILKFEEEGAFLLYGIVKDQI